MSKEESSQDEAKQQKREKKEKKDKCKPRTKIIIRHLPPNMTEEQFLNQVSPLPEGSEFYFSRSDPSLEEYAFCRAYVLIPKFEDQILFRDKFDNYIFLDNRGIEYAAIVEYAPFQKFPMKRVIKEPEEDEKKKNAWENDPGFIRFLESRETVKTSNLIEFPPELTDGSSSKKKMITTTPLLEYIKEKHAEKQRIKEEKKRKEIERKKMIAEEKRKKAADNLNFKNFSRNMSPTQNSNDKTSNERNPEIKTNMKLEESGNTSNLKLLTNDSFKKSLKESSNSNLPSDESFNNPSNDTSNKQNQISQNNDSKFNRKKVRFLPITQLEHFQNRYKKDNIFHSYKHKSKINFVDSDSCSLNQNEEEHKEISQLQMSSSEKSFYSENQPNSSIVIDDRHKNSYKQEGFYKSSEHHQEYSFKNNLDNSQEKKYSRIYTNSNWCHNVKKFPKNNPNQRIYYEKPKWVLKNEKEGMKSFQNKNKREDDKRTRFRDDENSKSRYRDEENAKSKFREEDNAKGRYRDEDGSKPRYRDDEKSRYKTDRRDMMKNASSFEKLPQKKQSIEGKKYEYNNPKYDQKKPHHMREYENKSYHKDYDIKSKDYDHKRQYHDEKRRPKNEWKNSNKDAKYKDYDSRSRDWESQGAKPRKKPPQIRKEYEEPKKIMENKNKSNSEQHTETKQQNDSIEQKQTILNKDLKKNEEIKKESNKDQSSSENEVKSSHSSSSKSESDSSTLKSADSKSNGSDSTLKAEPIIKDPRPERRIRNKDRPSLEIYRPGMGKFSRQRREQEKNSIEQESPTNSPNHLTINKTKVKT